ncbi:cell wall elongation regulator TseB-like domain-containing protein [Lentibacillus cibarius]|uniref:Cell wall elongation regulator TseB-like domain-containing protein n=1 Tax=Lentibacillus cibarius TaxID=2583219 RepID=A0A5S3QPW8_9BACI|nr:hypothetical protein [Lentibacillus cibarius]TMN23718.1 hypothetical protein FFL34_17625 [Lentibacillus cibarius]
MNNRFPWFTVPGWLKWLAGIICLAVVFCLITVVYLYQATQQERTASFKQVKQKVLKETAINTIDRIERFHGSDAYHIIYGKMGDQQAAIMFYPFNENNTDSVIVNRSEIIPKKTIQTDWRDHCTNCMLFDITPALITNDKLPAWEITYENSAGRYIMEYVSMNDGKQIELMGFKRMFNKGG